MTDRHECARTRLRGSFAWCLLVSLLAWQVCEGNDAETEVDMKTERVVLTVVYDNRSDDERLKPAWGFACVVTGLEQTILFDTGADSETLLSNMSALGIDAAEIDVVVLSHSHWDHTGGLEGFLGVRGAVPVYCLECFAEDVRGIAEKSGAEVRVVEGPTAICDGARSTGEMVGRGSIPEQSLLLSGDGGSTLVTGCAHPGVVEIARRARDSSGGVLLVLGGFHLARDAEASVRQVVSDLRGMGVSRAAPCHCTGDAAIAIFEELYGDGFVDCRVGTRVDLGPRP